jgi:hypothetical protein
MRRLPWLSNVFIDVRYSGFYRSKAGNLSSMHDNMQFPILDCAISSAISSRFFSRPWIEHPQYPDMIENTFIVVFQGGKPSYYGEGLHLSLSIAHTIF